MGSVVWGCKTSASLCMLCSLSLQGLHPDQDRSLWRSLSQHSLQGQPRRHHHAPEVWPISLQLESYCLEKPQNICHGAHCQPLCKEQAFFLFRVGTCGSYSWAVIVSQSVFLANNKSLCHTCLHLETLWVIWVMLICQNTTTHQDLNMTNANFSPSLRILFIARRCESPFCGKE